MVMKRFFVFIVCILLTVNGLADVSKYDKVKINIILAEQSDAQELMRMADAFSTKAERREFVVNTLKRQALDAQSGLMEELNVLEANGLVEEIRPLWIVNSVSCYANEEAITAISQRKDILTIYQCEEFQCLEDESVTAVEHGADVMNMSLGQPLPDSSVKLMMRQACDNTLAAGVVAAVCAGNSRQIQMLAPVPYNIWSPGDCPPPHLHEDQMVNGGGTSCVICVGAVYNSDVLGDFSSEGPATWSGVAPYNDYPYSSGSSTNIGLIRPDVCAPGVNVKSLDFNTTNGYCLKSGTSMATPCVAGVIALMLSKDHELTPEQIDEILENTAVPLSAHKSNDFGSGRIDALAAVNMIGHLDVSENNADEISVYPNPASDIVNVYGCNVKNNQIDISNLPSGVYLMRIETSEGFVYKKLIKK